MYLAQTRPEIAAELVTMMTVVNERRKKGAAEAVVEEQQVMEKRRKARKKVRPLPQPWRYHYLIRLPSPPAVVAADPAYDFGEISCHRFPMASKMIDNWD
jgi:hypothetical protein